MTTINQRLEKLEQSRAARNGYIVVCRHEHQPGVFWRMDAPDDVFGQAQVDTLAVTHSVIIVEYVERHLHEQDGTGST